MMPCPSGQSCTSFGRCVGEPDAGATADAGSDAGTDAGTDAGMDAGMDAGPPSETCTPSTAGAIASDEDGDSAIDESCPWHFGVPHPVVAVHTSVREHFGPRLSEDGRRMYFAAPTAAGHGAVMASRPSLAARFGPPAPVPGLEAHPTFTVAVSRDEREIIIQVPAGVVSPGLEGLQRAVRATTSDPFGTPETIAAANVAGRQAYNPLLSFDGLELFFTSAESTGSTLYRLRRASATGPFAGPAEPVDVAGLSLVHSPALSRDGRTLIFAKESESDGESELYRATRASTDSAVFSGAEVIEALAAPGDDVLPYYSERTRELFWSVWSGTREWSPSAASIWRVEVCRDGPCPARVIDCAPPAVRSPDGLHCYTHRATPLAWSTAEEACVAAGGHLASIHTEAERALVWSSFGETYLWLGGTDEGSEGVFRWTSSEPWITTPWGVFDANNVMQPDNSGGVEHCLDLLHRILRAPGSTDVGFVNDEDCTAPHAYVCENELWPAW